MSDDATDLDLTDAVVASLAGARSARLHEVASALVRHLHAAIRETSITEAEWKAAIDFLTATGQTCTAERQEFILLSDVLGISMLVDAINYGDPQASESTVLGPFYTGLQPRIASGQSILKRPEPQGRVTVFEGRVLTIAGDPVAGATVEIWQTAPDGLYDVQDPQQPQGHLRGTLITDAHGHFAFESVMPVSYPIPQDGPVGQLLDALGRHPYRPAHIHFAISATGCRRLVTHLFVADDRYLDSDAVFGVKRSLIVTPGQRPDGSAELRYDFRLSADA